MRTSQVKPSIERAPPVTGRTPAGCRAMYFFIGCMSAAPGRDPCGLLKGALRLRILNIYRASSGFRWICDHERRRNELRGGGGRQSYGARWICESPLTRQFIKTQDRLVVTFSGPLMVNDKWEATIVCFPALGLTPTKE